MAYSPERGLNNEIHAVGILRQALAEQIGDDADLLADTIEGQTNLREAISAVVNGIFDDEVLLIGLGEIVSGFQARKERITERQRKRRHAVERAMSVADLTKLELPQATLSVRRVAPAVEIEDEGKIHSQFFVSKPFLDKARLKKALEAGDTVTGAHLTNGSQTLSIRRA